MAPNPPLGNPIRRSCRCERCWIGRGAALAGIVIWSLVNWILWHNPGAPGHNVWLVWFYLASVIGTAVLVGLAVLSFFIGCSECARKR